MRYEHHKNTNTDLLNTNNMFQDFVLDMMVPVKSM